MTFAPSATTASLKEDLFRAYAQDPILAARSLFPHWFPRPMPWYARGIVAIILRRTDFLLNFEEERWSDITCRWTKKKLAKLVRCFHYRINPADLNSPTAPVFIIRYGDDGRTPVAIDMALGQHVLIIIPRGFSKTTIINFCNIYKTLFGLTRFTVYISKALSHAGDQLATIRRELATNEKILALFGVLKPTRADDESWGADGFETMTGVKFAAKGRGAQIRGLNRFGNRPDTLVLDDIEDDEAVETEAQRDKVAKWYSADVEQALDRSNPDACVYAIGTLLHPKALLATLSRDPSYTSVIFGAIDPEGEPLWDDPAGLSLEKLELKKASMAAKGQLYSFFLEFMSTVKDDARLSFKKEYIRYAVHKPSDFVARAIHIDPAIGKHSSSCYSAIAVVGLMASGQKHVCDFLARKGLSMYEQAEELFRMKIAWDCTHVSCESVAYQAALAQHIREMQAIWAKKFGYGAFFEVKDVWPGGRKLERVEGILQPLMASGYLTFQQIWPELEVMLLDWPNSELDGPDAIAGAISDLEPFALLSFGDAEKLAQGLGETEEESDFIAPCKAGTGGIP